MASDTGSWGTHPVFHGLLDESEALPARVKLLLVSAAEKHEVTDDLQSDAHRQKGAVRPSAGPAAGRNNNIPRMNNRKTVGGGPRTLMMTKSDFVSSSECSKM